jgi:hypothetical protein
MRQERRVGIDLCDRRTAQRARSMDRPLLADQGEQFGGKPGRHEAPVGAFGTRRVEQPCDAPRHEAVGIKEILLQPQPRKGAFQVPDRIVGHAVAQDEILRACGEADRVGLDETEGPDGAGEGGRRRRGLREDSGTEVVNGHRCRSVACAEARTHRLSEITPREHGRTKEKRRDQRARRRAITWTRSYFKVIVIPQSLSPITIRPINSILLFPHNSDPRFFFPARPRLRQLMERRQSL